MERIIFEVIPPPITWDLDKVQDWASHVGEILQRQKIFSLNLSEVVNETREGERSVAFVPKLDNVEFAAIVRKVIPHIEPIPAKISVKLSKPEMLAWVERVYVQGIRHAVLVGGESNLIEYPGMPVVEAAQAIKQAYPDMTLGGITIFTRPGEHLRIIKKMKSGIEFFVSQIIFETANLKQVIHNLSKECAAEGLAFPRIYISLSPASRIKDIEFMKWLGVEFPSAVLAHLTQGVDEQVEPSTFEVIERVLDEIFHFLDKEPLPLGFNIEHVMYTNLDLAEKLLIDVKKRIFQ